MSRDRMPASPKTQRRRAPAKVASNRQQRPYHHGALREALVEAAERLLAANGIEGLTLRAAAREAGVSHAAPKNHFEDVRGLQSAVAAVGFRRLSGALTAGLSGAEGADEAMDGLARAYVGFAKANPALFKLMYRAEKLDFGRPELQEATAAASGVLQRAVADRLAGRLKTTPASEQQLAGATAAWCLVHGFATLLLDGRLAPVLARMTGNPEAKAERLLDLVLAEAKTSRT